MQGHLLGTSRLFPRRALSPLVQSLISSANTAETAMHQRPRRNQAALLPPAPPHHRLLHQTAPLAATPQRRGLCSAEFTVSLDARSEGRWRKEKKKKCFCCDKCQLCLCLKRTVALPNGTLSNVQKPYIEVRRLPRSEIVWLPWGRGRGRIIGKPLLWMFGHTTKGQVKN